MSKSFNLLIALDDKHAAAFWSRVLVREKDECWPWSGKPGTHGYGQFKVDGTPLLTHRVSLFLTAGRPPVDDMWALHSCHKQICCNPRHLRWGYPLDNSTDMVGACRSCQGERHWKSVLTPADILSIRVDKRSNAELERVYKISRASIRMIKNGTSWKHISEIPRHSRLDNG